MLRLKASKELLGWIRRKAIGESFTFKEAYDASPATGGLTTAVLVSLQHDGFIERLKIHVYRVIGKIPEGYGE